MTDEMRKALAEEIAAVAIMMRGRQFMLCLSSGDSSKEDVKEFVDFFADAVSKQHPDGA